MANVQDAPSGPPANLPEPPRSRLPVALGALLIGSLVLTLAASGVLSPARTAAPPPIEIVAATPSPTPATAGATPIPRRGQLVAVRPTAEQRADLARFRAQAPTHVPARWVAGFYPLYGLAARTFTLNWLLLASIHAQETSFSTAADTYHGLNFAGCCGGPMQFNVTNRPVSTWSLVSDSYRYARRPGLYPHPTARHPSIYDDYDAMMASGRLLAADGAGMALDFSAWRAAYDYYGHDPTGVTYADQVVARAIGWSQRGFCINCALSAPILTAVHAAYGAAVLATFTHLKHRTAHRRAATRRGR